MRRATHPQDRGARDRSISGSRSPQPDRRSQEDDFYRNQGGGKGRKGGQDSASTIYGGYDLERIHGKKIDRFADDRETQFSEPQRGTGAGMRGPQANPMNQRDQFSGFGKGADMVRGQSGTSILTPDANRAKYGGSQRGKASGKGEWQDGEYMSYSYDDYDYEEYEYYDDYPPQGGNVQGSRGRGDGSGRHSDRYYGSYGSYGSYPPYGYYRDQYVSEYEDSPSRGRTRRDGSEEWRDQGALSPNSARNHAARAAGTLHGRGPPPRGSLDRRVSNDRSPSVSDDSLYSYDYEEGMSPPRSPNLTYFRSVPGTPGSKRPPRTPGPPVIPLRAKSPGILYRGPSPREWAGSEKSVLIDENSNKLYSPPASVISHDGMESPMRVERSPPSPAPPPKQRRDTPAPYPVQRDDYSPQRDQEYKKPKGKSLATSAKHAMGYGKPKKKKKYEEKEYALPADELATPRSQGMDVARPSEESLNEPAEEYAMPAWDEDENDDKPIKVKIKPKTANQTNPNVKVLPDDLASEVSSMPPPSPVIRRWSVEQIKKQEKIDKKKGIVRRQVDTAVLMYVRATAPKKSEWPAKKFKPVTPWEKYMTKWAPLYTPMPKLKIRDGKLKRSKQDVWVQCYLEDNPPLGFDNEIEVKGDPQSGTFWSNWLQPETKDNKKQGQKSFAPSNFDNPPASYGPQSTYAQQAQPEFREGEGGHSLSSRALRHHERSLRDAGKTRRETQSVTSSESSSSEAASKPASYRPKGDNWDKSWFSGSYKLTIGIFLRSFSTAVDAIVRTKITGTEYSCIKNHLWDIVINFALSCLNSQSRPTEENSIHCEQDHGRRTSASNSLHFGNRRQRHAGRVSCATSREEALRIANAAEARLLEIGIKCKHRPSEAQLKCQMSENYPDQNYVNYCRDFDENLVTSCSICLEEFRDDDKVRHMKCSHHHVFHAHCIDSWACFSNRKGISCPLCNSVVLNSDQISGHPNSCMGA
eukprot:gene671-408_t